MAELWELICHHTYKGIPGVVFDRSPLGASHGRAWNIDDSEFWVNGAKPDSGCVSLHKVGGHINVPAYHPAWQQLEGLKAEVTLRFDGIGLSSSILKSNSFNLSMWGPHVYYTGVPVLHAYFHRQPVGWLHYNTYENSTILTPVADSLGGNPVIIPGPIHETYERKPFPIPLGRWITVGFVYDGFNTVEIYVNGAKAAEAHDQIGPLPGLDHQGLSIGGPEQVESGPFGGQVDDVKIWRLNPRRFTEDFFSRPMDDKTLRCWKDFLEQIEAFFKRHPECAELLLPLFKKMLDSLLLEIKSKGPETQAQFEKAARQYNTLWRAGTISGAEMQKVFADLIAWLRLVGIDPAENDWLRRILVTDCYRRMMSELKPPDCDKQAKKLLTSIAAELAKNFPGSAMARKGAD